MGARSESKAKKAIQKFNSDHTETKSKGQIVFVPMVLDALSTVADSAKQILQNASRMDILGNGITTGLTSANSTNADSQ
jgi:hypothetical protein